MHTNNIDNIDNESTLTLHARWQILKDKQRKLSKFNGGELHIKNEEHETYLSNQELINKLEKEIYKRASAYRHHTEDCPSIRA